MVKVKPKTKAVKQNSSVSNVSSTPCIDVPQSSKTTPVDVPNDETSTICNTDVECSTSSGASTSNPSAETKPQLSLVSTYSDSSSGDET